MIEGRAVRRPALFRARSSGVTIADFIRERLPLQPVPTVPEVRLHLAGPASGMGRVGEIEPRDAGAPYWAYVWGGGLALARHVLDRPDTVAGRAVLDLGSGSGLVAIAAMKAGAARVVAADVSFAAAEAARLNAAANGVAVEKMVADLLDGPPPSVDVTLVGDLFYEAVLATRVLAWLQTCRAAGIPILIGDPGRATLPLDRLAPVAEYPGADFGGTRTTNAVFSVR